MNDSVPLCWVFLLPLLGAILNGLWVLIAARAKKQARRVPIGIIANLASFGAFFYSVSLWLKLLSLPADERHFTQKIYEWMVVGDFKVNFALSLDPLSAVMILIVTGVGSLIHLYSIGYMREDKSIGRYFVYLNLFLSAMLILVLADNLPLMFVGWEGVGLCSYLLIGFWFTDPKKASAGKKAFIVNRVGDLGFLLGIFLCFVTFNTVQFSGLLEAVKGIDSAGAIPPALTLICLCLFVGACGKSAQFPLHVWLADAMAGPTPVSALIHAATMVTAGVYMVARLSFLFALVPNVGFYIALVGTITALFAALIALVENDIKKVLAYSTVSQLGYMFMAVGSGAYSSGVFHLMTHAFFKGLLFLGAGSVLHALHDEQDLRKMGGLATRLPITYWTFVVAWLCIIGFPLTSGFFSKDEILWQTLERGFGWFYVIGLAVAFLTAFYMTRLVYLIFWGQCRADVKVWEKSHESPLIMWLPLVILAVLAAISGIIGHYQLAPFLEPVFATAHSLQAHLELIPEHKTPFPEALGMVFAITMTFSGAGLAWVLYQKQPRILTSMKKAFNPIYQVLSHKFYIDEIYEVAIIKPLFVISEKGLWKTLDEKIIDGFLNGLAKGSVALGGSMRVLQPGLTRYYALSIALGVAVLLGYVAFLWKF